MFAEILNDVGQLGRDPRVGMKPMWISPTWARQSVLAHALELAHLLEYLCGPAEAMASPARVNSTLQGGALDQDHPYSSSFQLAQLAAQGRLTDRSNAPLPCESVSPLPALPGIRDRERFMGTASCPFNMAARHAQKRGRGTREARKSECTSATQEHGSGHGHGTAAARGQSVIRERDASCEGVRLPQIR